MFWQAVQNKLAAMWTGPQAIAHLFSFRAPNRGDGGGSRVKQHAVPPAAGAPLSSSPATTGLLCLLDPQPPLSAPTGVVLRTQHAKPAAKYRAPNVPPQRRRSARIDIPRRPRAAMQDEYYRPRRWNQPDFQYRYQKFLYARYFYQCLEFNQRFPTRRRPTRTQSWPGCLRGEGAAVERARGGCRAASS